LVTPTLSIAAEIQKTRPAIIVNEDAIGILPLRVIVPLADWKEHYQIAPWMVRIDPNTSNGLCFGRAGGRRRER